MLTTKEKNAKRRNPETTTFHWYNENPLGKLTGDCVLRAIGYASGKGWKKVAMELNSLAVEMGSVCNDEDVYIPYMEQIGFTPNKQPRKPNNGKYTGSQFCRLLDKELKNNEKVVAHIGGHHIVCICKVDGRYKVNDTWDSSDYCIGKFWIK